MELRLCLFQRKIFFVKLKYIQVFGYIPSMDWCGFRDLSSIGFQLPGATTILMVLYFWEQLVWGVAIID